MNKEIEMLYKTLEAKDKIINNQVLMISELNDRLNKAIEHCKNNMFVDSQFMYEQLEILGDKENE